MKHITLTAPLYDSVRVQKIEKAFDCDPKIYCQRDIQYEVPPLDSDWQIGLIVGPSGAGKTTVAKELLGDCLYEAGNWRDDCAMCDNFPPEVESEKIHFLLTAVGLSSVPCWIKPYSVLSNGEKFRADLALALSQGQDGDVVAFDEYTSVVDRTVAKTASMALNKQIKKGRINRRFVAVTCHYDLIEWLQPDWILDMESGACSGGCQRQRPEIRIEIRKTSPRYWELFERHHYLRGELRSGIDTWVGFIENRPACICLIGHIRSKIHAKTVSRWVVMPEFQGIGIGTKFVSAVAAHYRRNGWDVYIRMLHEAGVHSMKNNPDWVFCQKNKPEWIRYFCKGKVKWRYNNRYTYTFRFRRGADKNYL